MSADVAIKFYRLGVAPDRVGLIRKAVGEPGLPPYSYFSPKAGDFVEDFDSGRSVWNGDASEISAAEAATLQAALTRKPTSAR